MLASQLRKVDTMIGIDTKNEIDQLDSEVERLRTKTLELKSNIKTLYNA